MEVLTSFQNNWRSKSEKLQLKVREFQLASDFAPKFLGKLVEIALYECSGNFYGKIFREKFLKVGFLGLLSVGFSAQLPNLFLNEIFPKFFLWTRRM